ncbi:hypothetical protein Tco_0853867 [Tanacetum coccineum]
MLVSPPLPVSSPPPPASPAYPLGFKAAMIQLRAESPSTSHSLPLPPPIPLTYQGTYGHDDGRYTIHLHLSTTIKDTTTSTYTVTYTITTFAPTLY